MRAALNQPSSTPALAPCVAVIPAKSAPRFASRLTRLGLKLATPDCPPQIALLDMAALQPTDLESSIAAQASRERLCLLAVVCDPDEARRALQVGADDVVFEGASDGEFALRFDALRASPSALHAERRREAELSTLLDLTARYAAALDIAPLLGELTRRLADHLCVARCALVLLDETRGQGRVVASSDNPSLLDLRIELSRYPEIQEAVRTCQPVVIDDVGSHPLLDAVKDSVSGSGISAIAVIPLALQGKAFGVLLLRRASEGPFEASDISFAWTLAHATAIAVRNARTIERLRDETEQARAHQRSLRKSHDLMEKLFDAAGDAIVAVGLDGKLLLFNKSAARVFDRPDDLRECSLDQLFDDEVVTQARALSALGTGAASVEPVGRPKRVEIISRSGERVPVLLTSMFVQQDSGFLAIVIVFSDLREKTRLEAEISRIEAQLAEAERKALIVELAGTAAHELNQPLTCIVGYTDLLGRRLAADDQSRLFLDRIRQEGDRMAELVRKIGKISAYETQPYVGGSRIFDLTRASAADTSAPTAPRAEPKKSPED